jgi:hypothetical protein
MQQQTVQQVELTVWHFLIKLLDWPFLLFVVLLFFIWIFRKQLISVFSRGDILLSWGDRSIRLRELSENLDKELDPIREEIDAVKQAVERIQSSIGTPKSQQIEPPPSATHSNKQLDDAKQRIQEALKSGKYRWRSIERLAAIGGISENQTLDILRSDPEVVFSVGKSGHQIARLKSR